MLDSFHPRAGIVTVYRKSYMFDTPSQVCVTISGCPGWETASSVLWERLPQLAVAAFFKENDCEGEVVYTTDLSRASGSHAFNLGPVGAVIRSLMVLENSQYAVGGIVNECFPDLDKLLEVSNATNSSDDNSTVGGASVTILPALQGNASSNWLNPINSTNASSTSA